MSDLKGIIHRFIRHLGYYSVLMYNLGNFLRFFNLSCHFFEGLSVERCKLQNMISHSGGYC